MSIYSIPKFKFPKVKNVLWKKKKKKSSFQTNILIICSIVLASFLFGALGGVLSVGYFYSQTGELLEKLNIEFPKKIVEKETVIEKEYIPQTSQEEKVIEAVKKAFPSVVSIIITKDMPVVEQFYYDPFEGFEEFFGDPFFRFEIPENQDGGTEKREIGGGSGFIISEDGMVLTNRHVVSDKDAEYTVLTNEGKRFSAEVLALDPVKDLAVIKINTDEKFKPLPLGDSDILQAGQTVIAIGNALGEFQNTVSTGIVSGLGRNIIASGGGESELLENVIQTDAAINQGNSGGPLLNLKGEVIGINVARSQLGENIGFAIPINEGKRGIEQVKAIGKIVYPFLGIYYTLINSELKEKYDLSVDYGAWVGRNPGGEATEQAVFSDSAAQKAGIKRDDIILEFNGERITQENSLAKIIMEYNPGDEVQLKFLREGKEKNVIVILGERS